jgi:peptide-methionine (S)-S-oxide reductase
MKTKNAVFAGGCFWCLDAVFRQAHGVLRVGSGYMGGLQPDPDYETVCTGKSGHAEVVSIEFDEAVISFETLLQIFFAIHDPTQLNRQGNDVGTQYRSAIFWTDPTQGDQARQMIAQLEHDSVFSAPIVTEVLAATPFYPAETYHQDYYQLHPEQGYCSVVISPKLNKFRTYFKHLLKPVA